MQPYLFTRKLCTSRCRRSAAWYIFFANRDPLASVTATSVPNCTGVFTDANSWKNTLKEIVVTNILVKFPNFITSKKYWSIFTVRRYALHGLSHRNSFCPSVCLSVTLVHCVNTVRPTIMISSPYGSPIILVSGDITFIPKFEKGHPSEGVEWGCGWYELAIFDL